MKNIYFQLLFITCISSLIPTSTLGQEMVLVVERCKLIDQTSPINNIWVDQDNVKWVSNTKGLHKVLALDLVQKVSIPTGTTSLLTIRGGNAQIEWNTAEMQALLGNVHISSASYDPKTKSLWIGTQSAGAFQVSLSPLRILQRFTIENRKLTSNQINDIFIQNNGTIWIATNDGMLFGNGDKWTLQERYLNFVGVDAWGQNMWILGDDFLWQIDSRGKWLPIAIELKNVEGKLRDIAVDDEGRVWIASNMMTGYNVEANRYQRFGPGQYFTSQFVNCLDVDQDGSIWTGTDDKGLYLIQWEAAMTINILKDAPLDCKSDQPTAALSVKVTGGEPPFTYRWSNGKSTDKNTNLGAGHYNLTVTDSKGITKTAKYEIPDPTISVKFEIVAPSSGSPQGDGSVNLLVNGGSGEFVYKWDNGENQQLATKLTSGMHSVTITDENGCSATTAFNVPEKVTPLAIKLQVLSENKCATASEGSIEAIISGGKPPITYNWNYNNAKTGKISALPPGTYSVTVADAAGQTASELITLKAPPALITSAELQVQTPVGANLGQAIVKVSGGTAPYTYLWDNGEKSQQAKNLSPGMHTVMITDASGCTSSANVMMTENIASLGVIIKQTGQINCFGQQTASLRLDITGGKPPYTYLWNTGQTTPTADQLKGGDYHVTVSDVMGSTFTASAFIPQPEPITIVINADAPATTNSANGKATPKVTGGTGNYTYAWDNGETSAKASKLSPGQHILTVTDAAGCQSTASVNISENILELGVTIEQTKAVLCAGLEEGSVRAIVTGGKEPYAYRWSNNSYSPSIERLADGLYTLTITDAAGQSATSVITVNSPPPIKLVLREEAAATANNMDGKANATATGGTGKFTYAWDNGEKTARATGLAAGNHSMTVTDENGCTAFAQITITENILPLSTTINQPDKIICSGNKNASLEAVVNGGKSPYVYTWTGPDGVHSGQTISNLGAGNYALKVTDATGLTGAAQVVVSEPKPLILEAAEVFPATTGLADGRVILKASGGTGSYVLGGNAWSTSTYKVEKLSPGEHTFKITDAAGCQASLSVKITEDILPLTVKIDQATHIQCAGMTTAKLEATAQGGKPPYTYTWSSEATGNTISNLAPGTYAISVSDASGQKASETFQVKAPEPLKVEIANLRSATNDRIHDGKGSVDIKGGTGPYTYQWSSGETSTQAVKLPAGKGSLVVTDAKGCSATIEFMVREKVLPELTAERLSSGEPIRMEKIQFEADSTRINAEAIPSLDELYEFLYDNPVIIIEVSGHTNGLPADDYCDRISSERAASVSNYLISKGIEARRVISKGYGKRKPIATNQTAEGRKRNQRVEIRLIKIEE